jgi:hypothetical protein
MSCRTYRAGDTNALSVIGREEIMTPKFTDRSPKRENIPSANIVQNDISNLLKQRYKLQDVT